MRIAKIHFGHCVGKYDPCTNYPVTFVPGSARCSSALRLFFVFLLSSCRLEWKAQYAAFLYECSQSSRDRDER